MISSVSANSTSDKRRADTLVDFILPAIFIVSITIFGAMVFDLFPIKISRFALYAQLAILLIYFGVALYRLHFVTAAAFLILLFYIPVMHLHFAALSGSESNVNGLASFLPVLSFVVFCECKLSIVGIMRIIVVVAAVYLAIYVVGYSFLISANQASGGGGVLPAASGRGARLYLLTAWAAFLAFWSLLDTSRPIAQRLALGGVAMIAIWFSGSRLFQLMFLIYALFAVVNWTGLPLRIGTFIFNAFIIGCLLAGLFVRNWNPYLLAGADESAAYRALEYSRAINMLRQHIMTGIGIPMEPKIVAHFLGGSRYDLFFASDLGTLGVAVMFGVPGLLISLAAIYFCTIHTSDNYRPPEIRALQMTCLVCAAVCWFSPMLIMEPTVIFLTLLIAVRVRRHRQVQATEMIRTHVMEAGITVR